MLRLLVRDIASPDRADPMFPFLRCFDPYAGHSWASGHARFGDGNNNESSSEAMNAWYGIILLGEATGDRPLRDLGVWLHTTEAHAIHDYWFDSTAQLFPASYPASVVTMVWGGKGANGTWFTANPEQVHGINWLPIHAGSLYLGRRPEYVRRNFQALVAENQGENWDAWADLIFMYLALADGPGAVKRLEAAGPQSPTEAGNSRAHTLHWVRTLAELGPPDASIWADTPLHAVFNKDGRRTRVAYNAGEREREVRFSDGVGLRVAPGRFVLMRD
jgi:endoglucanase Acf2